MSLIVKIHQGFKEERVIVVSDKELLGKKFEEGKLQLDLCSSFYAGEEKDKEEIKELLKDPCTIHLTGEETIAFFLELGLIDKERVLLIKGIPHAEVCLI